MRAHLAVLLLLGLFALRVEPSSAKMMKHRAQGANHHQAGEIHMDEETLQTPALSTNGSLTPGKCPAATTHHHLRAAYCSEGRPCPGDQMCCRVGNILKCVLPEGVHRGYCPRSEDHAAAAAASSSPCSDDSQCTSDEKCCLRGGLRRCTKAQPEKRGLCPKSGLLPTFRPCDSECKDDRSCSRGLKCCFKDCGLKCVDPEIHHQGSGQRDRQLWEREKAEPSGHGGQEEVHPGQCPVPPAIGTCVESCLSDASCSLGQKCCSNGCGHVCMNVTGVKPGICPALAQSNETLPLQFCSTDVSCPGDQLCCDTMCGRQCVLPFGVTRGYCPREPPQSSQNVAKCSSDLNCGSGADSPRKKCCSYGHLQTCLEAEEEHPGMCPRKEVVHSLVPCEDKCQDDRDCDVTKKCCFSGCGRDCLDPVPSDRCLLPPETGLCKGFFLLYFYCPVRRKCLLFVYGGCGGNSNQFTTKEECQKSCGKINAGDHKELRAELAASHPVPVKPGTCPTLIQNNDTECGQFCSTDDSCPGSERCCQTEYGHQCMLPLEDQPGYCPRLSPQPDQATNCSTTCNNDQDCGSGLDLPIQKCCSNGCGQTCQVAEEEHPGVCPKRDLVNTFVPCNDTCRDDRECPLTQKCCFTGCSLGCLDSVRSDRCQLPPKTGPCDAAFRRYYYNPEEKKCVLFTYGGCESNSNNFKTKEACEAACGKISPEVCKLPKDPGPCEGFSQFYYYNSATRKCEIFVYGLCGGNGNRFGTKLECMMVCGQTGDHEELQTELAASQPVPVRPGRCPRPTGYGACVELCRGDASCPPGEKCCSNGCGHVCMRAIYVGPGQCPQVNGPGTCAITCRSDESCGPGGKCCGTGCGFACKRVIEVRPGRCPRPTGYGACVERCRGDASCPPGEKCCSNGCGHVCMRAIYVRPGRCPRPTGFGTCVERCRGDASCPPGAKCCSNGCGHVCMRAIYGAHVELQTELAASHPVPVHPGQCPVPPEIGTCVELCLSDASCSLGQKCCSNGCGHVCMNVTGGDHEELRTELAASHPVPDFCNLPSDPGHCDNSTLRFYHSSHTGQCLKFLYRGCGGNGNNFGTQLSCLQTCADPGVCQLPQHQGTGDALRSRFYYNPTSRTCEQFIYRGHGGNGNNFLTKADCLQFCAAQGRQ